MKPLWHFDSDISFFSVSPQMCVWWSILENARIETQNEGRVARRKIGQLTAFALSHLSASSLHPGTPLRAADMRDTRQKGDETREAIEVRMNIDGDRLEQG